jgi:hypothetical protein
MHQAAVCTSIKTSCFSSKLAKAAASRSPSDPSGRPGKHLLRSACSWGISRELAMAASVLTQGMIVTVPENAVESKRSATYQRDAVAVISSPWMAPVSNTLGLPPVPKK